MYFLRRPERTRQDNFARGHVQVLAHLLSRSLRRARLDGGLSLSFDSSCFQRFRRTFLAPTVGAPVTAPGQILFPVEFKTLRNTRIYFTDVLRTGGLGGKERTRRGFTPDPTRLVNVTKKRCILGRREKQTHRRGAGSRGKWLRRA